MVTIDKHTGVLISAVEALEGCLQSGGTTILQAAFEHSFFVDPSKVRANTPSFPERARTSREHYPGKDRGHQAVWKGRAVILANNRYAQKAWKKYTGRRHESGSGYSIRHIWGRPWDPDAFTAGWNLCYMPIWAGVLTEKQHQDPLLEQAVRQASWDLFFRDNPVCTPPGFVEDPGMDLDSVLGGQPLLILEGTADRTTVPPLPPDSPDREPLERIKDIKRQQHQSWSNICKAVRALQGKEHEPFGTGNVAASSKSTVRRIRRETNLDLADLEALLQEQGLCR